MLDRYIYIFLTAAEASENEEEEEENEQLVHQETPKAAAPPPPQDEDMDIEEAARPVTLPVSLTGKRKYSTSGSIVRLGCLKSLY